MYDKQNFPRAWKAAEETPVFGIVIRPPRAEAAKAPRAPVRADQEKEFVSA